MISGVFIPFYPLNLFLKNRNSVEFLITYLSRVTFLCCEVLLLFSRLFLLLSVLFMILWIFLSLSLFFFFFDMCNFCMGFPPSWLSGKESTCQCIWCRFDPWVRKIPWSRKWQLTPVFFSGKSHGQRNLAGCIQSMGSQKSWTRLSD